MMIFRNSPENLKIHKPFKTLQQQHDRFVWIELIKKVIFSLGMPSPNLTT